MLKIAICDDSPDILARLKDDLLLFCKNYAFAEPLEIKSYTSGSALLDAVDAGERFHIILLDVLMPLLNGIETAAEIRRSDKVVKIVFLTSSEHFALESYDVKAFSYILKGASKEKLFAVLLDAIDEITVSAENYTLLKTKTGLVKICFQNIEYIEVIGKTIYIHLTNGQIHQLYGTLTQIESVIDGNPKFIRPHRSYIVNMDYIQKLRSNEIVMVSNQRIPVSKSSYAEVKERYISYSFSGRQPNA